MEKKQKKERMRPYTGLNTGPLATTCTSCLHDLECATHSHSIASGSSPFHQFLLQTLPTSFPDLTQLRQEIEQCEPRKLQKLDKGRAKKRNGLQWLLACSQPWPGKDFLDVLSLYVKRAPLALTAECLRDYFKLLRDRQLGSESFEWSFFEVILTFPERYLNPLLPTFFDCLYFNLPEASRPALLKQVGEKVSTAFSSPEHLAYLENARAFGSVFGTEPFKLMPRWIQAILNKADPAPCFKFAVEEVYGPEGFADFLEKGMPFLLHQIFTKPSKEIMELLIPTLKARPSLLLRFNDEGDTPVLILSKSLIAESCIKLLLDELPSIYTTTVFTTPNSKTGRLPFHNMVSVFEAENTYRCLLKRVLSLNEEAASYSLHKFNVLEEYIIGRRRTWESIETFMHCLPEEYLKENTFRLSDKVRTVLLSRNDEKTMNQLRRNFGAPLRPFPKWRLNYEKSYRIDCHDGWTFVPQHMYNNAFLSPTLDIPVSHPEEFSFVPSTHFIVGCTAKPEITHGYLEKSYCGGGYNSRDSPKRELAWKKGDVFTAKFEGSDLWLRVNNEPFTKIVTNIPSGPTYPALGIWGPLKLLDDFWENFGQFTLVEGLLPEVIAIILGFTKMVHR